MRTSTRLFSTLLPSMLALIITALYSSSAFAFCGFYVAKADTRLFNQASKVVLARDGDRTVLTMANDYQGAPEELAIVIPVPQVLERGQINVGELAVIDHLDAYTAPRLVEYHDQNPCQIRRFELSEQAMADAAAPMSFGAAASARSLGVKIEAQYTVGEYDILILSAKESTGLETWLRQNDYRIPEGATKVLASYIKQDLKFFVAKVNLKEQQRLGYAFLRPLQVAYESPRFMLPIRLGTVNADGPQELFVFVLNRTGRVETTNYRTVKLPTDLELPEQVEDDFARFYRDMFTRQVERHDMKAVFLEYAWDMNWCDPCAADPLTDLELRQLGVFWSNDFPAVRPGKSAARNVFVTRLHVRYNADTFPEDLRFQETGDRSNFQGRYIIRHPWRGSPRECPQAADYLRQVRDRQMRETETLADLTGWDLGDLRGRLDLPQPAAGEDEVPWWKKLWGGSGR